MRDIIDKMLAPDPSDMPETRHRADEPYRNLLRVLLEDAVYTLSKQRKYQNHKGRQKQAVDWFMGAGDPPITFEKACAYLGLDEDTVRRKVEKKLAKENLGALSMWRAARKVAESRKAAAARRAG